MTLRLRAVALMASSLCACTVPRAEERPARIPEVTADGRLELERIVAEAAGAASVTLAPDAFVHDSSLTLERRERGGLVPGGATGRTLDEPVRVSLKLRGSACVLVRESDGREWPLRVSSCAPAR